MLNKRYSSIITNSYAKLSFLSRYKPTILKLEKYIPEVTLYFL